MARSKEFASGAQIQPIPISPDQIYEDLEAAGKVLARWHERVGQGIPGVDTPASEEQYLKFVKQLCGELQLAGSKLIALAEILGEGA